MGKKCCVYTTNYDSEKKTENGKKVPLFRFPNQNTEQENRQRWIEAVSKVNANLKVGPETVVCELHWPEGYPTYKKKGRVRPAVPPSVWPNIPQSIVPEPPPKPRETKRTSNHKRNVYPDEIDDFERLDKFDFLQLKEQVTCITPQTFAGPTTAFVNQEYVYIQSLAYSNGIPHFLLILSNELKFELFHHGVKIHKNRVTIIDRWSTLDETVRF